MDMFSVQYTRDVSPSKKISSAIGSSVYKKLKGAAAVFTRKSAESSGDV